MRENLKKVQIQNYVYYIHDRWGRVIYCYIGLRSYRIFFLVQSSAVLFLESGTDATNQSHSHIIIIYFLHSFLLLFLTF
jgi:hypothetical protein